MAIGVKPETELAQAAGLEIGSTGGIKVDHNYRTNDPAIYAVGDAIEVFHKLTGKPTRLALAGPAQRQARAAADAMYGKTHNNGMACEYTYENLNKYQLTVYEDYKVPSWFKEGILYHVFVDRFNNGNRNGKVDNPKKNSFLYGNWDDEPM